MGEKFTNKQIKAMENLVKGFDDLRLIYFCFAANKKQGIGKFLAEKAVSSITDERNQVELALSAPEVQEYLKDPKNAEKIGEITAKRLSAGMRGGFFIDDHFLSQALSVLEGKGFNKQVIQKLNPEGKAFQIIRDDVVRAALYAHLSAGDDYEVGGILYSDKLKVFLSPEKTAEIINNYVDNKLNTLAFKDLEERLNSEAIGHLFDEDTRRKISERKAFAENQKQELCGKKLPKSIGSVVLKVPLAGFRYSSKNNEEFRKELDFALDVVEKHTDFSWWDLMQNPELHKYLKNKQNREDFYLKAVTMLRDRVTNTKKIKLTKKGQSGLKKVHVYLSFNSAKMYILQNDFIKRVVKKSLDSPAHKIIKELMHDCIMNDLNEDWWSLHLSETESRLKQAKGSKDVFNKQEIKHAFRDHLDVLIKKKRLKRIADQFFCKLACDYVSRNDTISALKQAVEDKLLTQEQFNQVFKYENKSIEKRNKEDFIVSKNAPLSMRIRTEIAKFAKKINEYHPYAMVAVVIDSKYNNEAKKKIIQGGVYKVLERIIKEGKQDYFKSIIAYFEKGIISGTLKREYNTELDKARQGMAELFGSFKISPKKVAKYINSYLSNAAKEKKTEEAFRFVFTCLNNKELSQYIQKNEITEPYLNLYQMFKSSEKNSCKN